jgi:hypothetical protein
MCNVREADAEPVIEDLRENFRDNSASTKRRKWLPHLRFVSALVHFVGTNVSALNRSFGMIIP